MSRLPRIRQLRTDSEGQGFFLCARKERRLTRNGEPFLAVTLQDVTGQIAAKLFAPEFDRYADGFDAGEFVLAQGRVNVFNNRPELILSAVRRVNAEQDRAYGFREEDCVSTAPRSADDMWHELQDLIDAVADDGVKVLLKRLTADTEAQLRTWPAAQTVHHAYRAGLLEHVLQVARVGLQLAEAYDADADLVLAGAVLHDIGKLREIDYERAATYSREGNLVGHIGLGLIMVREAAAGVSALSAERLGEIEHLVASHHGSRELGALVEPRTLEAFILAAVDDLDAKIHQVRQHLAEDDTDGEFTSYHTRLKRSFLKPSRPR
jgi:3'-5' exoribonuclease